MTNDQQFRRIPKQAMRYYYILEALELIVSLLFMIALVFYGIIIIGGIFNLHIYCNNDFDVIYMLLRPWLKYKYTFTASKTNILKSKQEYF